MYLHLFLFLQTNIASACSELCVAMALLPLRDLIILELSSGSVTQPLGLSSKFSAESLWLIQLDHLGSAAHAWSVPSDLTMEAHAGHVAIFPQVSERVGSSQGPSRSR